MPKINPVQAAALRATVEKSAPVPKTELAKPASTIVAKPVATKAPITKPPVAKPLAAKPAAKVMPKKPAKVTKPVKEKAPKLKMERDSFTMPKTEYAQFYVLKERMAKLGSPVKKSELMRAGIMLLSAMTDNALKVAVAKVPVIKTGRPKKK